MTVSVETIREVMRKQEELNRAIAGEDWRSKGFCWRRAIWMEAAELMDCFPWKWWAEAGPTDWENVMLELADIYHFIISDVLQDGQLTAEDLVLDWTEADRDSSPLASIDLLVFEAAAYLRPVGAVHRQFVRVAHTLGFSSHDIVAVYFGKNVLNELRQEFGYKTGSYRKNWGGKEDNRVLMESLYLFPLEPVSEFQSQLKSFLRNYYLNLSV